MSKPRGSESARRAAFDRALGSPFQVVFPDGTNAVVLGGKVVHTWIEGERIDCGAPKVWDLSGDGTSTGKAGKAAVAQRMQAAGIDRAPRRSHVRRVRTS